MRRAARILITLLLVVTVLPLVRPTFHVEKAHAFGNNNILYSGLGHNSRDPLYRSPAGAVPTGTDIRLRLRATNDDLTGATVRVWNDRTNSEHFYPMTRVASDVILPMGNDPSIPDPVHYEFWEATLPASADPTSTGIVSSPTTEPLPPTMMMTAVGQAAGVKPLALVLITAGS